MMAVASILTIDGMLADAEATITCFEQQGYRVFSAQDSDNCFECAQKVRPDLVLLDATTSSAGIEVCRRLKASRELKQIPVIFIGASSHTFNAVDAFNIGAADYVKRPLQIDELLARVTTHIKMHRLRKQLEAENAELRSDLRSSEQQVAVHTEDIRLLSYALNQVHEAVYLIQEDSRFAYVNDEACRTLGYSSAELKKMGVVDLDPNIDAAIWAGHWADIRANQTITMESHHRRRDGTVFPIEVISNYFEYGGVGYSLGLVRDITERKQAEFRLRESLDLLQELSAHRDSAREEEKMRIAREIHDELGQQLTTLRLGLGTIGMEVQQSGTVPVERVHRLTALVDKSIKTTRDVVAALRPPVLDLGIEKAVQWLTVNAREQTGINCACEIADQLLPLDSYQKTALFRIVQESLTNIAKHAKANSALVSLKCEDGSYKLKIHDDGLGFDPHNVRRGSFGLIGMRERALMLRGDLQIDSKPSNGTTVAVTIPVREGC